jgi:hypothetical protein
MRHSEYSIPFGIRGTDRTVDEIETLVRRGAKDPEYIELARSILAMAGVPERDHMAEVHAIHHWVKSNTRYTNDSTEAEVLTSPKSMMNFYRKTGMFIGDCDEFVTLEGILLRSVGHPTRFTVISQAMNDPMNRMGHIYHEVHVDHQWVPLDPIMKSKPVGYRPPVYSAIKTYNNGMGGVGMTWTSEEIGLQREQHKRRVAHLNSKRLKRRLTKREAILTRESNMAKRPGPKRIIPVNGIQRMSPDLSAQQNYNEYPYGLSGRGRRGAMFQRAPKAGQSSRVAKAPRPRRTKEERAAQNMLKKRGIVGGHYRFGLGDDPADPKELFAKYAEKVTRYRQRIPLIRSNRAQIQLQEEFTPLYSQMSGLSQAFATSGASYGSKDITKLNDWVKGVNAFSRSLRAAEKLYGTGAEVTASAPSEPSFTGPKQPTQAKTPAGILGNIPMPVLLGGGALVLFMLMRK